MAKALDQGIEDVAVLIHGPPEIALLTMDGEKHPIPMLLVAWLRAVAPQRHLAVERQAPAEDLATRVRKPLCKTVIFRTFL